MIQVPATQVSQFHVLEMLPHAFVRVKLWRVSWQLLQVDELRPAFGQESLDLLAAMDGRPVPHRQQLAAYHPPHVPQKGDTLGAAKRAATGRSEERRVGKECRSR